MFDESIDRWGDRSTVQRERWSSKGHSVRLALLTWPVVALLGASFAAAACLLGDCDRFASTEAKAVLVGQNGTVKSIAFRPDGTMLSSVGVDGSMVVWDLAHQPRCPFLRQAPGQVRCAAFSPDNRLLATANPTATVVLHDLVVDESRALAGIAKACAGAACVAFAPDGAILAVGQQDGKISLWSTTTGQNHGALEGHTDFVASLAFAPDGTVLASSSGDRSVRIWDLATYRERYALNPANTLLAQTFSPDGRILVQCDQVTPVVRLWDMTTGAECAILHGPLGAVLAAAISPDGNTLAAADFQGTVTFWDLAGLKIRAKRLRHNGVRSLAFAPDGRALATGGFDGTIRIWDLAQASVSSRDADRF